jgi:hypothetical protein
MVRVHTNHISLQERELVGGGATALVLAMVCRGESLLLAPSPWGVVTAWAMWPVNRARPGCSSHSPACRKNCARSEFW